MKKHSSKGIIEIVEKYLGSEYKILDPKAYKSVDTPLEILHTKCNYKFTPTLNNIMKCRSRCPKCSGVMKKTTDIFKTEVKAAVGDDYSVLGEYTNTNTLIRMKHNICGYEYDVTPHNFLGSVNRKGRRCPKCSKHLKISIQDVKDYLANTYADEYELLSKTYKNNHEHLEFKHNICGTTFKSTFMNMKKNFNHCPKCNVTSAWTFDDFCKKVEDLEGNNYEVISDSIHGVDTKLKMKHIKCGTEYMVKPTLFLRGYRCPICGCYRSKGEENIQKVFISREIEFVSQKIFDDCIDKKPLAFDFFIPKYNLIIEYDGEQHYKPYRSRGDTYEKYKTTFRHDKIKDEYCNDKNLNILRIPYTEFFNIDEIINSLLDGLNNGNNVDSVIKGLDIVYPGKTKIEDFKKQS